MRLDSGGQSRVLLNIIPFCCLRPEIFCITEKGDQNDSYKEPGCCNCYNILVVRSICARPNQLEEVRFRSAADRYNPEEGTLSPQTVPSLQLKWSIDLGAPVTAQPIEMNDILYAATWGGIVYALDPASGSVLWMQQLGTQQTSCDDFIANGDVIGVTHTLTSDWGNGRIFAVSGDGLLHSFDAVSGNEWPGYPIQVMDDANVGQTFVYGSPLYSYENGSLYIATASACDEGSYRGQIAQVNVWSNDTPQVINRWFTDSMNGPLGGGIWGPGGVALDPNRAIYTGTGNAFSDPESYGYADKVVRLDLDLNVQAADGPFFPGGFDNDFGSTPILYQPPGCSGQVAAMNKDGALYVYNQNYIGNGPIQILSIDGVGGPFIGSVAYDSVLNQIYTGNSTDDGVGVFDHGLIAFSVQSDCSLSVTWQQPVDNYPVIPPIAANGVVYYATGYWSQVYAFDAASGNYLWDSGSLIQNGIYASPMVVNSQLFVAGFDHKLYAFGLP
jgi:outer membrane protein assembly factor BamB